jgi:hypothetical protein
LVSFYLRPEWFNLHATGAVSFRLKLRRCRRPPSSRRRIVDVVVGQCQSATPAALNFAADPLFGHRRKRQSSSAATIARWATTTLHCAVNVGFPELIRDPRRSVNDSHCLGDVRLSELRISAQ